MFFDGGERERRPRRAVSAAGSQAGFSVVAVSRTYALRHTLNNPGTSGFIALTNISAFDHTPSSPGKTLDNERGRSENTAAPALQGEGSTPSEQLATSNGNATCISREVPEDLPKRQPVAIYIAQAQHGQAAEALAS